MATYSLAVTSTCTVTGGSVTATLTSSGTLPQGLVCYLLSTTDPNAIYQGAVGNPGVFTFGSVPNGSYTCEVENAQQPGGGSMGGTFIAGKPVGINCTGGGTPVPALVRDVLSHTDETAAKDDGSITMQASGGLAPLTAELVGQGISKPATSGQPVSFTGLPPGPYTIRIADSSTPTPQTVTGSQLIAAYVAPISGCADPDATNYDPAVTAPDNATCRYVPRWVGAWAPGGVRVPVVPSVTPAPAYVTGQLWAGFLSGHPLGGIRPLAYVTDVRATVGPDGVAAFDLGPYLRPLLGAPGLGDTRRLDLNQYEAHQADLYCGWELYVGEQKRAHGYALNSVLDEERLEQYRLSQAPLTPWGDTLPTWQGFDFPYSRLIEDVTGRMGSVQQVATSTLPASQRINLGCPRNPVPVAWLTPEGSWAYWVFQGRPEVGDEIGEGAAYTEGGTGQRRYSARAASYETLTAWSGVFGSRALADGLRTLLRSNQVWYKPDVDGPWVPCTLGAGNVTAYRIGRSRYESTITLTAAVAYAVQGQ